MKFFRDWQIGDTFEVNGAVCEKIEPHAHPVAGTGFNVPVNIVVLTGNGISMKRGQYYWLEEMAWTEPLPAHRE